MHAERGTDFVYQAGLTPINMYPGSAHTARDRLLAFSVSNLLVTEVKYCTSAKGNRSNYFQVPQTKTTHTYTRTLSNSRPNADSSVRSVISAHGRSETSVTLFPNGNVNRALSWTNHKSRETHLYDDDHVGS